MKQELSAPLKVILFTRVQTHCSFKFAHRKQWLVCFFVDLTSYAMRLCIRAQGEKVLDMLTRLCDVAEFLTNARKLKFIASLTGINLECLLQEWLGFGIPALVQIERTQFMVGIKTCRSARQCRS